MAELLIEIGCEDLPAGSIVPLAAHLKREMRDALHKSGLLDSLLEAHHGSGAFATPRRIGAAWGGVRERQPDRDVERKGPSLAAAYDADGRPTKALAGFLRSAGASVADLSTIETPKGGWVVLRQRRPGRSLDEVVAEALPGIVASMPMPRRMRWGAGEEEFLRPVVWLLAVLGGEADADGAKGPGRALAISLFGMEAGDVTYGHRFHAPGAIRVTDPNEYVSQLEAAYVVAEQNERRDRVEAQVTAEATRLGGTAVVDEALLDEVAALVEWPVALAGRFDEAFLEIPDETLIQTMQENQRYFALRDEEGALMNAFVTVANIVSSDPAVVIDGNERVIRPRFADTMFFWAQDRARTLASMRPELERVLFQERLGSVGDKVERLEALAGALAEATGADPAETRLAASLCKCDLVSAIVGELPKMQGIAGRYYAARDGHPADVALAMEEHYFPKQAGGALPGGLVARTLALADKTDTLVGIHGQGLVPSGAKDPFGLRRAAIGIVRVLLEEGGHDLDLDALVAASARTYAGRLDGIDEAAIVAYVMERLRGYLVEGGASADAVDAVIAKGVTRPLDIVARLEAIERFRRSDAADALAAANKRIGNLLRKSAADAAPVETTSGDPRPGAVLAPAAVEREALVEPAELALADALEAVRPDIDARLAARDYVGAMTATATLREPVDAFFDAVMVMDEDARLRTNRLALLGQVESLCSATAVLARLVPDARTPGAAT